MLSMEKIKDLKAPNSQNTIVQMKEKKKAINSMICMYGGGQGEGNMIRFKVRELAV